MTKPKKWKRLRVLSFSFCHCSTYVRSDSTTPWIAAGQAPLSSTISWIAQMHVHFVGDAIQPSHSLSPTSLFAVNLSQY